MKKRSAIVISGAVALALLAGIVGANRAAITASTPQVVVQHASAQAPPQPTYTETERE
jgi:hypothetical protein